MSSGGTGHICMKTQYSSIITVCWTCNITPTWSILNGEICEQFRCHQILFFKFRWQIDSRRCNVLYQPYVSLESRAIFFSSIWNFSSRVLNLISYLPLYFKMCIPHLSTEINKYIDYKNLKLCYLWKVLHFYHTVKIIKKEWVHPGVALQG